MLGTITEKMKVGEFTRKLKDAVNNEGYTSNNVELIDVVKISTTFKVYCQGNDGSTFEIYIEED